MERDLEKQLLAIREALSLDKAVRAQNKARLSLCEDAAALRQTRELEVMLRRFEDCRGKKCSWGEEELQRQLNTLQADVDARIVQQRERKVNKISLHCYPLI